MAPRGFLVVDANVLVAYQAADLTILGLVHRHVGTVHIVSPMLAEVDDLDESECERLGLLVVEPTLAQVMNAFSPVGRLSFQDRTCLVVCRDNGWTCVSNDRALRRAWESVGVTVLWGLELMLDLVRHGHLPAEDASEAAERIHVANPFFGVPHLQEGEDSKPHDGAEPSLDVLQELGCEVADALAQHALVYGEHL